MHRFLCTKLKLTGNFTQRNQQKSLLIKGETKKGLR
jgi:hypothetical protein